MIKQRLKEKELFATPELNDSNFTLTGFVDYLKCRSINQFNMAQIVEQMKKLQISEAEVAGLIKFSPDNYTRNLFFKNDDFEILIMCWDSNQQSPIHDHAQSLSIEYIHSGRIINTLYHQISPSDTEVYQDSSEILLPGQVISSIPGEIHRISNPDVTPAVSVHLYSPPLTHIRCFNEPGNIAQLMTLGYFSM